MNCIEYTHELQKRLEDYFENSYSDRGQKFEPDSRHKDLKHIEQVYLKNGGGFWALVEDDLVIGSIALKILDRENGIGEIKRLSVLPQRQGKGYGKLLMCHCIKEAYFRDLKILRLDTMKSYQKALNLYIKMGFYEISRYNDNFDADIYMEVRLDHCVMCEN